MLNKLKIRKNESGFTLIELLVVIAIIGVLAAIAVPLFLSQQASAIQASLKSDVRNSASQLGQQLALGDITNPEQYLVMSGSNQVVFQSVDMKTFTLCGSNPATDFTWGFNSTTGSFAAGCNGGTGGNNGGIGGNGGVTPPAGITVDEQLVAMAAEALFNTYAQQGADLMSSPDYSGSFLINETGIASPDPNITFGITVEKMDYNEYYSVSVTSNPYTNTSGETRIYSIYGTFDASGNVVYAGNGSWNTMYGGGGGGGGYEPPPAPSVDMTQAYDAYVFAYNSTSEQDAVAPYQNTVYIGYAYDGWFDNFNGASMKTYEQFLSVYSQPAP